MVNKMLKWLYVLLVFAAPLIVYPYTSELFEFNKILFIYAVTLLVGGLWLADCLKQGRLPLNKTPIMITIALFLASQVLSALFSIDPHTSFFGYYGRFNGGILSLISYTVLFYVYADKFDSVFTRRLMITSIVSSFLVMLWGLPGKFGHDMSCFLFAGKLDNTCWTNQFHPDERMFSLIGQPNWLGAYLAINFFIALYLAFTAVTRERKVLFYAYLFLNYVCILFTRSRSALAALAFCFLPIGLYKGWELARNKGKAGIVFAVMVLAGIIFPILAFGSGFQKIDDLLKPPPKANVAAKPTAPPQPSGVTESFDIRKLVWEGAVNLVKRYPLFGTGTETFAYGYFFVRPAGHNMTSEWDYIYNKAHNEYLNFAATTGLVGLTAYFLMVSSVLFAGFRIFTSKSEKNQRLLAACIILAYLTILTTNFFGFSTTTINIYFYLIPAMLLGLTEKRSFRYLRFRMKNQLAVSLIAVIAVLQLIGLYSLGCYFAADKMYAAADTMMADNQYQPAASYLLQALQLRYEHVYQDKLSYALANMAFVAAYQKETEAGREFMAMAQKYNDLTLKESPKNVIYWKTRAKNQYLFYQATLQPQYLSEGLAAFKHAAELSPTDPRIPYSISIYYSLLYDEEKSPARKLEYAEFSREYVNRSLELKPDFTDAGELKKQLDKKYGAV